MRETSARWARSAGRTTREGTSARLIGWSISLALLVGCVRDARAVPCAEGPSPGFCEFACSMRACSNVEISMQFKREEVLALLDILKDDSRADCHPCVLFAIGVVGLPADAPKLIDYILRHATTKGRGPANRWAFNGLSSLGHRCTLELISGCDDVPVTFLIGATDAEYWRKLGLSTERIESMRSYAIRALAKTGARAAVEWFANVPEIPAEEVRLASVMRESRVMLGRRLKLQESFKQRRRRVEERGHDLKPHQ